MMQKCWDIVPLKRPTMRELWDFAREKSKEINNNNEEGSNNNYINIISGSGSSKSKSFWIKPRP